MPEKKSDSDAASDAASDAGSEPGSEPEARISAQTAAELEEELLASPPKGDASRLSVLRARLRRLNNRLKEEPDVSLSFHNVSMITLSFENQKKMKMLLRRCFGSCRPSVLRARLRRLTNRLKEEPDASLSLYDIAMILASFIYSKTRRRMHFGADRLTPI